MTSNILAGHVVMQFGGQHPGGMGVPAVGMAFPGYVAQPNGLGNSEMTWSVLLFLHFLLLEVCCTRSIDNQCAITLSSELPM